MAKDLPNKHVTGLSSLRGELERVLRVTDEESAQDLVDAVLELVMKQAGGDGNTRGGLARVLRDVSSNSAAVEAIHNIRSFVTVVSHSLKIAEDTLPTVLNPGTSQGRAVAAVELCTAIESAQEACKWAMDVGAGHLQIGSSSALTANLSEVFSQTKSLLEASRSSNAILSMPTIEELVELRAPSGCVIQVLLGLLRNADEAFGQSSRGFIAVDWWVTDGDVCVRVADNGPGIAEADRQRIFETFYSTKANGHGLGLIVSRRLVEEWGGTLSLEVSPLGGAAFVFSVGRNDG